MADLSSDSAAQGYKQASFSAQKVDGESFIHTDVCHQVGDVILDLGCGTGELSAYLAEKVGPEGKVIGVDPDKERIQLARQSHSGIRNLSFVEGSAANFPGMGSKVYDIVFSNGALHWIPGKQKAFKNMFESLKVGGKISFSYLDHIPPFELDAYEKLNPENAERICQMYQCESKATIEQYCSSAGFEIIRSYETHSTDLIFESSASLLKWHWATTHGVFDPSLVTEERLQRYLPPYCEKDVNNVFQRIRAKLPVCRIVAVKLA